MAETKRKTPGPGRPRKQKTARQLLARFLNQPLPPGTAKLGCLAAWAEGEEDPACPGAPEKTACPGAPEKTAGPGAPEKTACPGAPEKTAGALPGGRRRRAGGLELRMYEGMLLAQMARALEGDLKALQFIRETMGEREEEKTQPAAESLSAGDRALLEKLAARLGLEETP